MDRPPPVVGGVQRRAAADMGVSRPGLAFASTRFALSPANHDFFSTTRGSAHDECSEQPRTERPGL